MKTYFHVYAKSWKKGERVGPNFYMDFTEQAAKKGWLRLGLVILDSIPIAAGFAIVCDGFAYFAKSGYDERYKNLGAGSIWLAEMIKYVIDVDKVSVIDLLRGEDEYKRRWVAKRRERKGLLLFNNNLKGNCLSLLIQYALPTFNRYKYISKIKALAASKVSK
jgi:CelD/BcsL family acetyltransferase involved in cellulose biosynthesis